MTRLWVASIPVARWNGARKTKAPFVAAVQAHDQGHPLFVRFDPAAANFRWVNTLLGNLKRALSGTYPAFNFAKYARRDLSE